MDRIIYSTGDLDYSIGARVNVCAFGVRIPPSADVIQVRRRLFGLSIAYRAEVHRFGKKQAGHYTSICK